MGKFPAPPARERKPPARGAGGHSSPGPARAHGDPAPARAAAREPSPAPPQRSGSSPVQQQRQSRLHFRFAGRRRQVQDPHVLAVGAFRTTLGQHVVCAAEGQRGEEVVSVAVGGESAGLAHQRLDDMRVLDAMQHWRTRSRHERERALTAGQLEWTPGVESHLQELLPGATSPAKHEARSRYQRLSQGHRQEVVTQIKQAHRTRLEREDIRKPS
jgi:hypothetical protein